MKTFDWYKRYPRSALVGMFGLTLEQRGAYNTIIDLIYSRRGDVPDDEYFCMSWLRCDRRIWRRIRRDLLALGKLYIKDGIIRNETCDTVLAAAELKSANAVAAVRARFAKDGRKPTPPKLPILELTNAYPSIELTPTLAPKSEPDLLENNDLGNAAAKLTHREKLRLREKEDSESATATTPTVESQFAREEVSTPLKGRNGHHVAVAGSGGRFASQAARDAYATTQLVPYVPMPTTAERWAVASEAEEPKSPHHDLAVTLMLEARKIARKAGKRIGWVSPAFRHSAAEERSAIVRAAAQAAIAASPEPGLSLAEVRGKLRLAAKQDWESRRQRGPVKKTHN